MRATMAQYIDKTALVAEIENKIEKYTKRGEESDAKRDGYGMYWGGVLSCLNEIRTLCDTLEVKDVEDSSLEKFKSLQHITKDLHRTLEDWGYAPNLYFFDGMWHVSWISCEEGDSIKDFEGNTPEEAIDKACNWFHSTFCNG